MTLDVSDPTDPEPIGEYFGKGEATEIEISGENAFVANGKGGLEIFDISDSSYLRPLGSLETGEFVGNVAVAGDMAYLAEDESGLRFVDISEPKNPTPVGFFSMPGAIIDMDLQEGVAHVAYGDEGFLSIDVSDPVNGVVVGMSRPPDLRADGVVVEDGMAYVLYSCDLLRIYDISGPGNHEPVGEYEGGGCNRDIDVSDGKAFVIEWSRLKIIDVSDPANPVLLGSIVLNGDMEAVTVSGDLAYVSADYRGVYVIDVSDPTNPIVLETLETRGNSLDAAVVGSTVFVAAEMFLEAFTTECRSPQAEIRWESRGLEVDFSDASLFGPTSWLWDFGDSVTSEDQHPRHRYDAFGAYTVSLTVTNDFGSETETWVLRVPEGRNRCFPGQAD